MVPCLAGGGEGAVGLDVVDGPYGSVADHLAAIGPEPSLVLAGDDVVADVNLVGADGEMPARRVDLAGFDPGSLAALVEAFGCFVGRRHQQALVAGLSAFPPRGHAVSFHLITGAAVDPAVFFVDLDDGDVTSA